MSKISPIPFVNLSTELAGQRPEIDAAISRVLDSGRFILGEELDAFEQEFARYCGVPEAVGLACGLSALKLMLKAFDVGKGDEVIVPANTYIATWLAVSHVGAIPVPVEPEFATRNLDPARLLAAISSKTKAVLAVHLYGLPCDMTSLAAFCRDHGLFLLVDAAQACGAEWQDSRAACLGDAAAFSFYPTKNLATVGEAGAVALFDTERAERIRQLRNYGMKDRYHHLFKGENARMEEIHAAVLRVRLCHLDKGNSRRREIAADYINRLGWSEKLGLQKVPQKALHVWHLFTVTVDDRENITRFLFEHGVETAVHYPQPPHQSRAYMKDRKAWPQLPVTEHLARTVLSLPCYPSMSDCAVNYVSDTLLKGLEGKTHREQSH